MRNQYRLKVVIMGLHFYSGPFGQGLTSALETKHRLEKYCPYPITVQTYDYMDKTWNDLSGD